MLKLRAAPAPGDRYAAALARLDALVTASRAATLSDSIGLLLERVALSTSREAETDPQRVNLLTLHSTKGLEYSQVYVVGVEDERLPGLRGNGQDSVRETGSPAAALRGHDARDGPSGADARGPALRETGGGEHVPGGDGDRCYFSRATSR